jgi:hypothetical protein
VDNFSRLLLAWRGWGVLGAALEALPAKPHAWPGVFRRGALEIQLEGQIASACAHLLFLNHEVIDS